MSCLFAVLAASAVLAAFVPLTMVMAMMAAVMIFAVMMTMVVALGVGVELETALRERLRRRVRRAGHAAVERNACFRERVARAHSNAFPLNSVARASWPLPSEPITRRETILPSSTS